MTVASSPHAEKRKTTKLIPNHLFFPLKISTTTSRRSNDDRQTHI